MAREGRGSQPRLQLRLQLRLHADDAQLEGRDEAPEGKLAHGVQLERALLNGFYQEAAGQLYLGRIDRHLGLAARGQQQLAVARDLQGGIPVICREV